MPTTLLGIRIRVVDSITNASICYSKSVPCNPRNYLKILAPIIVQNSFFDSAV